jgi:hypothetical protein
MMTASNTSRKRLQAVVNRFALRKQQTAKSVRGQCCFCVCPIRPGDQFRASCSLVTHDFCFQATSAELGGRH